MSIETGGNAFPAHTNPRPGTLMDAPQGMTLRDYFAASALQGMLAYPGNQNWGDFSTMPIDTCAEYAYQLADAMLRAQKVAP